MTLCLVLGSVVLARPSAAPDAVPAFMKLLHSGNTKAFRTWLRLMAVDANMVINEYKHSLLHKVAIAGEGEFATILVQEGAKVEAPDADGLTPIDHAELWGEYDVMVRLLAVGAVRVSDVDPEPEGTLTGIFLRRRGDAFMQSSYVMQKIIPRVNCLTIACSLFAEWLARFPGFSAWKKLTDAQHNSRGRTQLQEAVVQKKMRLMELLFTTGAVRLEEKDFDGWRAIHHAVFFGHLPELEFLHDKGADINALTDGGKYSPLSLAALMGHTQVVQRLLEMGADHTQINNLGMDALQLAAVARRTEVAQTLLIWGASVDTINAAGKTTSDIARENEDEGLADLITTIHGLHLR